MNALAISSPRRLVLLRDILYELVMRDMKLRYKRSLLGLAWSLVNPLAQMLVLTFVFNFVLPLRIDNYIVFLFTGLLAWNWFQSALFAATGAIVDNRDLIRRPGFPAAILPMVTVTSQLVHFILAFPILLAFLLSSNTQVTPAILFLPFVILIQFTLTLGIAYLLATFQVTFRDTQYLLGIILLLGFYMTPVFYNSNMVPEQYHLFYDFNPMVQLIQAYRAILLQGRLPDFYTLSILGLVSSLLLTLGYRVFVQASFQFAEEL
ncbi:MAG: ABC transporter permease [Chloroflexi bacterium]|nr:ABC transporter permease [Chloroflexota bacterium]